MQVPASTLNENQKKTSLSAKKGKGKKFRPVLASKISFKGFEVSEEHEKVFEEKLVKYFKYRPPVVPKWSELKTVPKEERRKMRKLLSREIPSREHICLGINEVTRAIENKTATVVIVNGNMSPFVICRHIYQCCDIYKIPLIKVNNFKEASKKCFGFSAMCMAFKQVPNNARIYEFYKFVQYWFVDELLKTPAYMSKEEQNENEYENIPQIEETNEIMEIDEQEEDPNRDVYLYRNNKFCRKFVPKPRKEKSNKVNAAFIAFDDGESTSEEEAEVVPFPSENKKNIKKGPSKNEQKFEALKLKKIQKNQNRKFANLDD